jgi:Aspartyl protease
LRRFRTSSNGWRALVLCGGYLAAVPYGLGGVSAPQDAPTTRDSEALLFATPTTHDHVGRVVVPVRINGQGPFRFIVDTGADHSTISPALVQLLGLKPESQPMLLQGITGSAQVSFVTVDRLQAGELTLAPTELPVVWAPGPRALAGRNHSTPITALMHCASACCSNTTFFAPARRNAVSVLFHCEL